MLSIRSRLIKRALRFSLLLREVITNENLEIKRAHYARLARYFRVPKFTKITPIKTQGFAAEWIDTPSSRHDVVMLYVHGGGFVFNSTPVHRELISRIASVARVRAVSLDYSLAPEHPYPAAINEALAAYKWLLSQFSSHKIVFAGDSAGGSIVLSLLHVIRNEHLPNPACAVALSPATDAFTVDTAIRQHNTKDPIIKPENLKFFIDSYFQKTPRNDPIASPLYSSLEGFPPLLIHADKDELLYSNAKNFVEKAKKEEVEVTFYESNGLWHAWHAFAGYIPEARTAIQQIGEFLATHT